MGPKSVSFFASNIGDNPDKCVLGGLISNWLLIAPTTDTTSNEIYTRDRWKNR